MQNTNTRTASCCCGDVTITVRGEPHFVHGCHCGYCQKRTGSVWQVSCWYYDDEIESVTGDPQIYVGLSESFKAAERQEKVDYHFCRRCGSTVYWKISLTDEMVGGNASVVTGIAVGCFVDKDFPEPISDHYLCNRQPWLAPLEFKYMRDKLPTPEEGALEMP